MKRHGSMNHIYRLVWSHVTNGWVAVAETARGKGKGSRRKLIAAALALTASLAQAAPVGGQLVSGAGSISQSGATTTITQASPNLSLTWKGFNIGSQETVNFVQPSASAIAVNRIYDTQGTQILGHLNANGQVYLINPNGVLFGQGAQVNVGGLVASTLDLNDASLSGNQRAFSGNGTGSVVNQGTINAAAGGYVALLGNHVSNQGVIVAQLGSVALGAGSAATLTFSGNSLVNMQVSQSVLDSLAENGGLIRADGGLVVMSAGAKDTLLASVVNNTGVIEARTVENHAGTITLLGGMTAGTVNVGGTLDASAPHGGNGGFVDTSAANVKVGNDAKVTTAAATGQTGTWLIDPQDYTVAVGGGDITGSALSSNLANTSIELKSSAGGTSGSGNVNVNDAVAWNANTTLTLTASNNVNVNANITATGATAGLVINPNTANGSETASGSGIFNLNNGAAITLSGATPSLSIAGQAYTVINSLGLAGSVAGTDLQGINGNLSGHYALGSNIDATATSGWNGGTGFAPIGTDISQFSGTFDGLGHTISNLTVNLPAANYVGLFGMIAGSSVIRNVGLVGGSMIGSTFVGGLVADNQFGTVSNSYATGSVSGNYVGGLIGHNKGTVSNSYATGSVIGGSNVGGLVGYNDTGTVSNSYATGRVSGGVSGYYVGGLIGGNESSGTVSNSYATGSVSGGTNVGGLMGVNFGTVSNSYATGGVSGGSGVGGLIGVNLGRISSSYWDTDTSGSLAGIGGGLAGGATGLTTAQAFTQVNYTGFDFSGTWYMVGGSTRPFLRSEYSTTITNAHQLQLMGMNLAANYTLANNLDLGAELANPSGMWRSVGGFAPIGAQATQFTGTFDGLGHTISNLTVNRPVANYVGLFGMIAGSSVIQNVGLVGGSLIGHSDVGELVGYSSGTVRNSYATGSVRAATNAAGGLIGLNNGTIDNSYATGGVSGGAYVGGLVGLNQGSVSNSYATGSASGISSSGGYVGGLAGVSTGTINNSYATASVNGAGSRFVGGLVGGNMNGTISNSYATGSVTNGQYTGGLVGYNSSGTVINSFWDIQMSGQSISDGGLGLTTAQMQQQSSFGGWDFGNTWIVYNGFTNPLLRSFMTPLTVTANSTTVTYDGQNHAGQGSVSYSSTPNANLLGTVTYGSTAMSGSTANAGTYTVTPSGLYSNQQGYILSYVSGTLTVNPASLTVSSNNVTKTYDGTLAAAGSLVVTNGTLYANASNGNTVDSVSGGNYAFVNANVLGAGNSSVAVSGATVNDGNSGNNYVVTYVNNTASTITPKNLTVAGTSASDKVYDGGTTATLSGGTLAGVIGSDVNTVALNQSGTFASANAGTGIGVTATDSLTGSAAGNYTLAQQPAGLTANITPKSLTVAGASAGDKVYDGTTVAALSGGSLVGVIGSDANTVALNQSGTFASANVGTGIGVTTTASLSGSAAGNYTVAAPIGLMANITPKSLTVAGTSASDKVYDGTTVAALSGGSLVGVIGSDANTVALNQSGTFASANAGTGIGVTTTASLSGSAAGNYTVAAPIGFMANITPKSLTVAGVSAGDKVYDSTTTATLSGGTLVGVIGSDANTVALNQSGAFASANAGTGIAVSMTASLSGSAAGNYTVAAATGLTANITPKSLTVAGTSASDKVYDGTTVATLTGGLLVGIIGSDTVTLAQAGSFASANPGADIAVTAADTLGGSAAGNYIIARQPAGLMANITAIPVVPVPPVVPVAPITPITPVAPVVSNPVSTATSVLNVMAQLQSGVLLHQTDAADTFNPSSTFALTQLASGDTGAASTPATDNGAAADATMTIGSTGPALHIVDGGMKLPNNIVNPNQ